MARYFGIPLRNSVGLGIGGAASLSSLPIFTPTDLFIAGEQGAWYDPSDFASLYQDAAGTTAVTAVEQSVGLMLDKRRGLPLGAELVTNNTFATDSDWTKGTGWSIGSGVATKTAGTASVLGQAVTLTAGVTYRLVFTITRTAGSIAPQFTGGSTVSGTARSAAGTYVQFLTAVSGNTTLEFSADASFAGTVDNVYLKQVSGNDAYQITSASRPVLRARYNLLEYSEQIDNAYWLKTRLNTTGTPAWVNVGVAPDGTTTAEKMIEDTSTNTHEWRDGTVNPLSYVSGQKYTISFYAKAAERTNMRARLGSRFDASFPGAYFNLSDGTVYSIDAPIESATITAVGDGWYRCTLTDTAISSGSSGLTFALVSGTGTSTTTSYTGDGTSGILFWGAQVIRTNVFTPNTYQRIAASTDYVTGASFPPYLAFDGTDDSLLTQSADFTGTDAVTVFAGLAKLSDAAQKVVVELSADIASNNGTFLLAAPDGATATFGWDSKGTSQVDAVATSVAAPRLAILTGIADISADSCDLRVNGASADTDSGDQGTGNYGAYSLFIGRRNNASLPLNGNLYSLIIRGAACDTQQILQTEKWINGKMDNLVTLA